MSLQRKTPLKRSGRLAPRSRKTIERQPEREAVIQATLARAGNRCEFAEAIPEVKCWHPKGERLDTHEIAQRGTHPGSQYDIEVTRAACRRHHEHLHAHPTLAVERGLKTKPTT